MASNEEREAQEKSSNLKMLKLQGLVQLLFPELCLLGTLQCGPRNPRQGSLDAKALQDEAAHSVH